MNNINYINKNEFQFNNINNWHKKGYTGDNNIGDDIMDFKDVDKNRWSAKNIDLVSDLGLMNGYPDGTFKPAQPVTREEIATVLANLVNNFNVKQK